MIWAAFSQLIRRHKSQVVCVRRTPKLFAVRHRRNLSSNQDVANKESSNNETIVNNDKKKEKKLEAGEDSFELQVPRVTYAGICGKKLAVDDVMCRNFEDPDGNIKVSDFLAALNATGLDFKTDVRLKEFKLALKACGWQYGSLERKTFKSIIKPNIMLINRAMTGQLVIPDWQEFTSKLEVSLR